MKDADKVLPKPELGDAWLKFVREQRPKPHIRFWAGRWYVHPDRETTFAIASGATVLTAWASCQLIEYDRELLAAVRGGKLSMNVITAAWRRLRGERGQNSG